MKKNLLKVFSLMLTGFVIISCSSPANMVKNAEQISAESNPQVLEVVADKIEATYTINFPEGYFHPNAILEILPVLVYPGGEIVGAPLMLQGEKVTNNHKVVTEAAGQISGQITFDYVEGVEESYLELRLAVYNKETKIEFPVAYKIADGANTTYMLVDNSFGANSYVETSVVDVNDVNNVESASYFVPNSYQKIIKESAKAQILYLINNATVRPSQLRTDEIKCLQKFLAEVEKDERRTITSVDITAYSSPDGELDFNTELSEKRAKTATTAFSRITRKTPVDAPINTTAVSEDWEGFKKLVEASSIEDKDLILRVLSMYSDPAVREAEIKNMSSVFEILAKKILPALRRAQYIANIDYKNYTDEELIVLIKENPDTLNEEALLYAATLVQASEVKSILYLQAAEKFNSSQAYNDMATILLSENKLKEAAEALAKVTDKNDYYYNNMGVLALYNADMTAAATNFAKSKLVIAKYNSAILDVLNGKYDVAADKLVGAGNELEGLAYILTKQYDKAAKVLTCECPYTSYLKAIIAARQGNATVVEAELAKATKEEAFKLRAETDIEFAKFRK